MSSPGAIAFQVGPVVIRWYGILMALAIVVGLWLGHREARKQGLPADDIISVGQWAILAGLVGARMYEVIFNWDYYGQPSGHRHGSREHGDADGRTQDGSDLP